MATITVVQGRGTYPAEAISSGAATGTWTELETGASANSWAASKGDILMVYNAGSDGDTIGVTVEGTTNPYGVQPDKTRNGVDNGQYAIFDFGTLEGWVSGDQVNVTVTLNGVATANAAVLRPSP